MMLRGHLHCSACLSVSSLTFHVFVDVQSVFLESPEASFLDGLLSMTPFFWAMTPSLAVQASLLALFFFQVVSPLVNNN